MASLQKSKYGIGDLKPADEEMQDSWVDLAPPSRGSSSSVTTCTEPGLTIDANSSSKGSRLSPKSSHSPNVELSKTLEAVKFRLLAREIAHGSSSTDFLWDWSSRPEAIPPKQYLYRNASGTITTPPNSPDGSLYDGPTSPLSLRHSKIIRNEWFSVEVLSWFIVSNVVIALCAGCVGWILGRKFPRPPSA